MKSKSTVKRSASKSGSSTKRVVVKKAAGKSRKTNKQMKAGSSKARGAASTAPVVYQTLRERIAAVEENVGQTETLSKFITTIGW